MNKQKLIPIIVGSILLVIVIILGILLLVKKNTVYNKLIVNYQDNKTEYTELNEQPTFSIGSVTFRVAGHDQKYIILASSEEVTFDKKDTNEMEIKDGNKHTICIASGECFELYLSR